MKTKKVVLIVVLCIVVLLIAIWGIREYVLWNDGKLQKDNPMSREEVLELLKKGEEYPNYHVSFVGSNNEKYDIYVKDNVLKYIVEIVNETRKNENISIGISPRGSIAILKMAKANAIYNDRDYVTDSDVLETIIQAGAHRIELSAEGRAKGYDEKTILSEILKSVKFKGWY